MFDPVLFAALMSSTAAFTPLSLFAAGEQGAWYDPSDFSTMFQDAAGTTPVTAVEQPVGLLLDKSKGLALGAELVTNGTFDTNTTGWTSWQTGTLSVDTSRMKVENGAATISGAYQLITVVVGRTYKFEGVKEPGTAASPRFYLGTSVGGTQYAANATSGQVFLATSTTLVVTAATQSTVLGATAFFDNISVKELAGNHASQSTAASRPVLSARVNLLTYSEQFDNAAWSKSKVNISGNAAIAPDGQTTADKMTHAPTTLDVAGITSTSQAYAASTYTFSLSVKVAEARYVQVLFSTVLTSNFVNVDAQTATITGGTYTSASATAVANGFVLLTVTVPFAAASGSVVIRMVDTGTALRNATFSGASGDGVFIWGADLRVTNVGVNLPAYQRVAEATDYDTSGFPLYLKFDGVDDSLATGTIDFTATDKMSVFAGVRKLSDAASALLAELSATLSSNAGSFYFGAPELTGAQGDFSFKSRGSIAPASVAQTATLLAPITRVLTGLGDISGDISSIRQNGVQVNYSADQGTGNYGNYPLFIGRRNNASFPYNGNLYSLIVRGALSTDAQLASTETYVNNLTKAY